MGKLGVWIDQSKPTTSSVFEYSFNSRKGYYRAVDWQQFLLYVVPTMVVPNLKYVEARNGLMSLVDACSIALQKEITSQEVIKMETFLFKWQQFLANEISNQRLNVRVWTMNNHFTTYHMADLIRQQGPLRHYSCRSFERTIQKYTNLSRSRARPAQENENILAKIVYYKQLKQQTIHNSLLPPRLPTSDAFLDHPDGITIPQLWKKFMDVNLNDDADYFGFSSSAIANAIQKYYHRTTSHPLPIDKHARFSALIDFSITPSWYVGEVVCYLAHNNLGCTYFLAIVSVAKEAHFDSFKVPTVTLFGQFKTKKLIVCNVLDIISIASLLKYNNEAFKFKVIWPEAKFYRKLNGRKTGRNQYI
ncbi:hypothetical protein BD560DRAFT_341296 [Blakeslea trispora]|nr:hypothetical protein BD560DRAFT_341296 [Blakeslea trispora]